MSARRSPPGLKNVRKVVEHMEMLAGAVQRTSAGCKVLALRSEDFETIGRYPVAARLFHIRLNRDLLLMWRGFMLVRA